jgi:hypothetical protein
LITRCHHDGFDTPIIFSSKSFRILATGDWDKAGA